MAKNKSTKVQPATHREAQISAQTFDFFSDRRVLGLLLFALVVAVFLPCIRNEFFYWFGDDPGYVTENAHVKNGFTVEGVKWCFRNMDLGNWHPLTFLSHMLDCQIYGLKPWGHHLTSVLLHAANTLLLFIVLRRMTGTLWRSLVVALLFGLHPLRVESVAWVAERKDVLAVFFWMLTLWFYARFAEESKAQSPGAKLFYGLALAGFACGLMSKGIVVTLPFVLLLLDYWPLQRSEQKSAGKLWLEKVPFFALAIATSVITYAAQKSWGFVQTVEKYSLASRLENAAVSYVRYIGKMFWPAKLGYYPHPGHWPASVVVVTVVFLLGISVLAFAMRRKWSWLLVGWLWYLGTLVPVIGLVQLGDVAMANRYSYIPMVGILVPLVWGLHEWTKQWRNQRVACSVVTAAVLVACIALSIKQIGYFKDSVTACRYNFEMTGDIDVAQYALALSLDHQGQTDESIRHLQSIVKARPGRADVRFNLATTFQKQGRMDEAIEQYVEVLKLSSGSNDARYNLGLALLQKGDTNAAAAQFQQMIQINHDARACNILGTMLASSGKLDDAINYFKEAVKAKPDYAEAHNNLGIALADAGHPDEAIRHFQEVLRLDPASTVARTYLDALQKTGKPPDQ